MDACEILQTAAPLDFTCSYEGCLLYSLLPRSMQTENIVEWKEHCCARLISDCLPRIELSYSRYRESGGSNRLASLVILDELLTQQH